MTYQIIRTLAEEKDTISPKPASDENSDQISKNSPTIKKISKKQLINKINYLNFQDEAITINFRHKKYNNIVSYQALPELCLGEELICKWVNPEEIKNRLKSYSYENILIKNGDQNLLMKLDPMELSEDMVKFRVPDIYFPLRFEKNNFTPCRNINAQLIQNSVFFNGTLQSFGTMSLNVKIKLIPPQTSHWINSEDSISVVLSNRDEVLYSGECDILRELSQGTSVNIMLSPKKFQTKRFKSKKFRSIRRRIEPSPNVFFTHPFTGIFYDLNVFDISGSGFSVKETVNSANLLPGMILPQVEMQFANSFKINFKAQVIYRKIDDNEKIDPQIKCGFVFLDILSTDHLKLLSFLQQYENKNVYICGELNMDSLWNFFFESGFIYPEKYLYVKKNKEEIKKLYETIYSKSPNIARHFTLQNNGNITGHLAMIRFYENTWLIHHHAASKSASHRAGLIVLNQIGHYSNDSHSLCSSHMDYLMCYFRPENKFPNRVFGGAARTIDDRQKCSIESFLYFHHKKSLKSKTEIPWNWSLTYTTPKDLEELEEFYVFKSGGLLLKALDIQQGKINSNGLSKEYKEIGLLRKRFIFSLKKDDVLIAIIMVDISNMGLNLSDLTSGAKVIILDSDILTKEILDFALSLASARFQLETFPVLIYPTDYANNQSIDFEKIYSLWILDTKFGDYYFRYVNRLSRLL